MRRLKVMLRKVHFFFRHGDFLPPTMLVVGVTAGIFAGMYLEATKVEPYYSTAYGFCRIERISCSKPVADTDPQTIWME